MNGKIALALALGVVALGTLAPAAHADRDDYYHGGYREYRVVVRDSRRSRLLDRVNYLQRRVAHEAREGDVGRRNAAMLQHRLHEVEEIAEHDAYISDREYDRCQSTLDWVAGRVRRDDLDRHY